MEIHRIQPPEFSGTFELLASNGWRHRIGDQEVHRDAAGRAHGLPGHRDARQGRVRAARHRAGHRSGEMPDDLRAAGSGKLPDQRGTAEAPRKLGEDFPNRLILTLCVELPPYRLPTLRGLVGKMQERAWLYLRRAGTVILAISIVMWAISAYPRPARFEIDRQIAAGTVVVEGSGPAPARDAAVRSSAGAPGSGRRRRARRGTSPR